MLKVIALLCGRLAHRMSVVANLFWFAGEEVAAARLLTFLAGCGRVAARY